MQMAKITSMLGPTSEDEETISALAAAGRWHDSTPATVRPGPADRSRL
jgi:hypothetical protein